MDPITICMALAQFAPTIAGWLGGSKAQDVAQKVVGIAQAVTNTSNPDQAVAAIQNDPAMAEKFQEAVLSQHLQLAQLAHDETMAELQADIAQVQSVNQTMQIEAAKDHWPSYSWRPFIGFMFGLYVAAMWILPLFHVQPVALSPDLTLTVGGILGVASFFRGKMQADPRVPSDNRG